MDWSQIASVATALSALGLAVGFGLKQAKDKGHTEEKMSTMGETLHNHDIAIVDHTATLAAHEGSFKVIDVKMDNIKEVVDGLATKLDRLFSGGCK
jgi:hypothetical protein